MFNGKAHYVYGHFQVRKLLDYLQRVIPPFSYGFPMVFYGFPIKTSIFLWFSYGFPMKTSIFRENDQLNCHGTWTAAPAPFAPRTPKHHRAARASRRPRHPGPVSPGRRLALRSQLQGVLTGL